MPSIPPEIYEILQQPPIRQRSAPLTKFIVLSCLAVFSVQIYYEEFLRSEVFTWTLAASRPGLAMGFWWQIITYAWIHSVQLPIHIAVNLLMIYPIGKEVERTLGSLRFAAVYLVSVIAGAAAFFLFSDDGVEIIAGASAAAFGLLTSIAVLYPNRRLDVLLFFIIPLRLKVKTLAAVVCGIELLFILTGWLAFVSHTAHLGGALAGLIITWLMKPKQAPVEDIFPTGFPE